LNPQFFRSYEFNAVFPEDWKLEIQIYDKGSLSFTDALIGACQIDLEDRVFGELYRLMRESLNLQRDKLKKQLEK